MHLHGHHIMAVLLIEGRENLTKYHWFGLWLCCQFYVLNGVTHNFFELQFSLITVKSLHHMNSFSFQLHKQVMIDDIIFFTSVQAALTIQAVKIHTLVVLIQICRDFAKSKFLNISSPNICLWQTVFNSFFFPLIGYSIVSLCPIV